MARARGGFVPNSDFPGVQVAAVYHELSFFPLGCPWLFGVFDYLLCCFPLCTKGIRILSQYIWVTAKPIRPCRTLVQSSLHFSGLMLRSFLKSASAQLQVQFYDDAVQKYSGVVF